MHSLLARCHPVRALAAISLLAVANGLAAQTTVVVPCDRDNTLYESATGSLSNGRGMGLFVGVTGQVTNARRRTLVHFDVASVVPTGARVVSVRLDMNVSRTAVPLSFDVMAHRVLRNWGEGTSNAGGQEGSGAAATAGDATWRHSVYPSTLWTNLGGDFVATPSCPISTPSFGIASSPVAASMNADVQGWLENPAQNFGWLLKTDELVAYKTRRFDSREAPLGSVPPTLTISYLLPGQATSVGQGCPVNGQPFQATFAGAPVGGTSAQLLQSNGPPNGLAANLFALNFDPVGMPLLPQCSLYLPSSGLMVTHNLLTLDGAGNGSTPYPVPLGYPGVLLVGQTAALDNSPQGYVLSNAWIALLN